jgi:hypothetical protein
MRREDVKSGNLIGECDRTFPRDQPPRQEVETGRFGDITFPKVEFFTLCIRQVRFE